VLNLAASLYRRRRICRRWTDEWIPLFPSFVSVACSTAHRSLSIPLILFPGEDRWIQKLIPRSFGAASLSGRSDGLTLEQSIPRLFFKIGADVLTNSHAMLRESASSFHRIWYTHGSVEIMD